MNVKPILFNAESAEMVQAILDGRKSCTRRLVKFLPGENPQWTGYIKDGLMLYNGRNEPCVRKAPYQPGDILYVRETWQYLYELDGNEQIIEGTGKYYYAATDTIPFDTYVDASGVTHERVPWHPSIYMPKEAARIWLKVTDVRVERLQEISGEGALTEGTDKYIHVDGTLNEDQTITSFIGIWNNTIKKADLDRYGWNANPWVWVIEFAPCEKEEIKTDFE